MTMLVFVRVVVVMLAIRRPRMRMVVRKVTAFLRLSRSVKQCCDESAAIVLNATFVTSYL
jgi:hypothetical protein